MKIYINGHIHNTRAFQEIFEPGFLFGWGVFETLRVYQGSVPFLKDHLRRLKDGCKKISLIYVDIDYQRQIQMLLKENRLQDAYCRITVFKKRESSGLIIYVAPFTYYNDNEYAKGFTAITSPFVRNTRNPLVSVKAISYLENRLAWKAAQDKGKDEALFCNEKGNLCEGSRTNLFFIKRETIYTPSCDCGMLNGITRQKVISQIRRKRLKVQEGLFKPKALRSSDEAFLTSSLMEVMPLVEFDGKSIGNGKSGSMTEQIHLWYKELACS